MKQKHENIDYKIEFEEALVLIESQSIAIQKLQATAQEYIIRASTL
ncbi:MAG: hypothetical protein M0Q26_10050 [Chitinophagaceae bacterium]|nr:hypothetical protein [Chitinophagaceae bacterium]